MNKIIFLLLLLISCTPDVVIQPEKPFAGRWNNPAWDSILMEKLDLYGKELLATEPVDLSGFNGTKVSKEFWANIIIEMAYYESDWKPATSYKESFKDQKGNYVISRGLLQISIESGKGYQCPLKTENDLHDVAINIECGVRILNRWVSRDKRIAGKVDNAWRGASRYWSVMRQEEGVPKKSTDAIKAANK